MKYALGNMLNGAGSINPDGLALDLQFAADKTLTARRGPTPVLTRASTATFVGSNGLIQSAAINAPRFDHDPVTLESRGLLIEEPRQNLLNGSQTFATSGGSQNNWVDTNVTRDGTLRTSPDGTTNALRITASAANGTVISSAAAGSSAARVFSIFLRRVTGTGDIQYTLDNGSTWTTQAITGSWVRYTFAATTANQQVGIRIVTSGDSIEIWGAQLEAGSFATSYIPTTTSSLTRSADVCNITGADFSGMWNASEGSIFTRHRATGAIGNRFIFMVSNNADANAVDFRCNNSGVSGNMLTSGASQLTGFNATYAADSTANSALALSLNNCAFSVNGASAIIDTSATLPMVNRLDIGNRFTGSFNINGTISAIRYYKKRLPNAKLVTLTT